MSDVNAIKLAVCLKYGITPKQLIGQSRYRLFVTARHVAMVLCHRQGMSYPDIGRAFGGRHHTTVMAAVGKLESLQAATASDVPAATAGRRLKASRPRQSSPSPAVAG